MKKKTQKKELAKKPEKMNWPTSMPVTLPVEQLTYHRSMESARRDRPGRARPHPERLIVQMQGFGASPFPCRKAKMNIVLNLTIKGKWFAMIAWGDKKEEYRDCLQRQAQRAYLAASNDPNFFYRNPVAVFRNGYTMQSRALVAEVVGFDLRGRHDVLHREWGEPTNRRSHIVIKLGEVLLVGRYQQVKKWILDNQRKGNHHGNVFDNKRHG